MHALRMPGVAARVTTEELARLREWQGRKGSPSSLDLRKLHKEDRRARRVKVLCLTAFRKLLRGRAYNTTKETRGRKRSLGPRAVTALNKKRRELVIKLEGAREVSWEECIRKSRVKTVHPTTAKAALARAGIVVSARAPREKSERTKEHVDERHEICRACRFLLANDF